MLVVLLRLSMVSQGIVLLGELLLHGLSDASGDMVWLLVELLLLGLEDPHVESSVSLHFLLVELVPLSVEVQHLLVLQVLRERHLKVVDGLDVPGLEEESVVEDRLGGVAGLVGLRKARGLAVVCRFLEG